MRNIKLRLQKAQTRAELLAEAKTINAQSPAYLSLAYVINTELATGRVLKGAQSLLTFNQNLTDRVNQQQIEESLKVAKLRGLSVSAERSKCVSGYTFKNSKRAYV